MVEIAREILEAVLYCFSLRMHVSPDLHSTMTGSSLHGLRNTLTLVNVFTLVRNPLCKRHGTGIDGNATELPRPYSLCQ